MSNDDAEDISKGLERVELVARWGSLPPEVQDLILAFLPLIEVFRLSLVCKSFAKVLERGTFQQARVRLWETECFLSPLVFYAEEKSWHLRGFDSEHQVWRRLPPFKLPPPDPELFKDFLVVGDKGLFCVNVGKADKEELHVCNLLTGATSKLPALSSPRHPVVLNVHVTLTKKAGTISSSFWVIAAGSVAVGTEGLSRKTEFYESALDKWLPAGDVPGTDFSLNDYQSGAYCESQNLLLCTGFMVNGQRGILAFDVGQRKWRDNWICAFYEPHPVADTALTVHYAIAQLVICGGVIYLFSEQEADRNVRHCIDRLDLEDDDGGFTWTRVLTRSRQGNRALLVYPEFTCVPLQDNKLAIFNTIERKGEVYDMFHVDSQMPLPPPPNETGILFHSLNAVGYAFEPSFAVTVPPRIQGREAEDSKVSEVLDSEAQKSKLPEAEDPRAEDVKPAEDSDSKVLESEPAASELLEAENARAEDVKPAEDSNSKVLESEVPESELPEAENARAEDVKPQPPNSEEPSTSTYEDFKHPQQSQECPVAM